MKKYLRPFLQSTITTFVLAFIILNLSSQTNTIYACHSAGNDSIGCPSPTPTASGSPSPTASASPSATASPTGTPQRQGVNICHNTNSQGNPWQGLYVDDDGQLQGHYRHGDFNYGNGPLNNNGYPDNSQGRDAAWCLALAQELSSPTPDPTPTPTPEATITPSPTPTLSPAGPPSDNGNTTGQVLGASTSSGQVLGASTTAKTGTAQDIIGLVLITSGTILVGTSLNAYKKVYSQ